MPLKFAAAFIFVTVFSLFAAAQEVIQTSESEQNQSAQTRLFDEFGATSNCDLNARIHNIFVELGQNPGTRAYIILYRGSEALPVAQTEKTIERQTKRIKDEVRFMMLDAARLETADGGFRKTNTVWNEVWIIPEGGAIPQPSKTVEKPALPVANAYKVDRSGIYFNEARIEKFENNSEEEIVETNDETVDRTEEVSEETAPVDSVEDQIEATTEADIDEYSTENDPYDWLSEYFGNSLKENKNLNGVVIFYADETEFDISKLRLIIEEGMRKSSEKSAFVLSRVKVVYGGYRENAAVEFWIVPKGAKEPQPTPETPVNK